MTVRSETPGHSHNYLPANHDALGRRTLAVVVLTAVTMVVEIAAGWVTGSMALLADGFHMATHAGALGLSAAAYAYARSRADDPAFCFGTGKVGDLAGFASALILALVALGVGAESVARIWAPGEVAYAEAAAVAVLGLVVNLASVAILGLGHPHGHGHGDHHHHHDHGHGHAAHHHDHGVHHHHHHDEAAAHDRSLHGDTNFRAALAHVVTDAMTSVLAIIALVAGAWWGMRWVDPAIGLLGAALILLWSIRLLRESSSVLLDITDPEMRDRVEEALSRTPVSDLHVWCVGPRAHAAIVSVTGTGEAERIREDLAAIAGIAHVTVEVRG